MPKMPGSCPYRHCQPKLLLVWAVSVVGDNAPDPN
jgi:hypothetical protein